MPFFDGNALDAARFLFGASGGVFWQEGSLHIENWLLLQTARRNIPQGQRNSTMSRFAGKLVKRYGVTEEAYMKFLEQSTACNPPLSDTELQQIWKSAERFGTQIAKQKGYIAPEHYGQLFQFRPEDYSDLGQAKIFAGQVQGELATPMQRNTYAIRKITGSNPNSWRLADAKHFWIRSWKKQNEHWK